MHGACKDIMQGTADAGLHNGEQLLSPTEAKVEATVLGHIKSKKITVYKMRPKKKTRKKQGYRSNLTRVMINSIQFNGSSIN